MAALPFQAHANYGIWSIDLGCNNPRNCSFVIVNEFTKGLILTPSTRVKLRTLGISILKKTFVIAIKCVCFYYYRCSADTYIILAPKITSENFGRFSSLLNCAEMITYRIPNLYYNYPLVSVFTVLNSLIKPFVIGIIDIALLVILRLSFNHGYTS